MDLTTNAFLDDLEQPRYFGAPVYPSHAPGFVYTLHRHHGGMGESRTSASGFMFTTEHSGTHIDALCHQAEDLYLYGGRAVNASVQTPAGFTELGAETIAPLITCGILLDVAHHRGVDRIEVGKPITRVDLEAVVQNQDVPVREGDVVLVRTGTSDPPVLAARGTGQAQATGLSVVIPAGWRVVCSSCSAGPGSIAWPSEEASISHDYSQAAATTSRHATDRGPAASTCRYPSMATSLASAAFGLKDQLLRRRKNPTRTQNLAPHRKLGRPML